MVKLETALSRFDEYNSRDPHTLVWEDKAYPAEFFYAMQLYKWVKKLEPEASEALLLASRAQHIGRWTMPRESYPMNKAGYLNWRSELAKFHAGITGQIMRETGYEDDFISRVQEIILKKNIKTNKDVQVMENALCLVFLEFQYEDFISKHDDEKVIRIVQKSWKKMSQPGREAALTLAFKDRGMQLMQQALQP